MDRALKPATYRSKEMQTIARFLLAGESGSVVGLAGCGRSNLLDFLCHRPEVLSSYLPHKISVVLIPVDLNHLPTHNASTLYRLILRSFYWMREHFNPNVRERVTTLYIENRATTDPFLSQSALHEMLFAFQAQPTKVVLVLNRFDRFYGELSRQMLNSLRGLRDSFKETLCFIVGMRQEMAYLPDVELLGDMYELLDSHICWVGAMNETDARYVIDKTMRTAEKKPSEAEIKQMLTLTGHFPVLLKAIGYWWLEKQLPLDLWQAALRDERIFDYRLERLWNGLTQEEQFVLSAMQTWQEDSGFDVLEAPLAQSRQKLAKLTENPQLILSKLLDKGVIQREPAWQIRGELLAAYVKRVGAYSRGRIRIDEETGEIYHGLSSLRELLAPLEDKLLRTLIEQPRQPHPYSDLMQAVWSEERSRNDLFQLVRNLRQKIEPNAKEPRYLINLKGNPEGSYVLYPEGRPSGGTG